MNRRSAVAALAASAAGAVAVAAASAALAAPPESGLTAGRAGATWLTTQLENGVLTNFGVPDIGLTIDALFALRATGVAPATATAVADAVAANAAAFSYYDYDHDSDGDLDRITDAGSTAKLLLAAVSTGRDPAAFGGLDLDASTRALVATDGPHRGRVRDTTPEVFGGDASNTFDQAFAVLGLARTGGGVPADVVDYLLRQQCPGGGFRLNPDPGGADCVDDAAADVDPTAMAVQALLAGPDTAGSRAAVERAAAWLESVQAADGSFRNGPQQADPNLPAGSNSNSTGLAAQALAAAGRAATAGRAAGWVAGLQLTGGADGGAIAYDPATFGSGAVDDLLRDQWRRTTTQAVLGLAQVPMGELGKNPPPDPGPDPGPSGSGPSSGSSGPADPVDPVDPVEPVDPVGSGAGSAAGSASPLPTPGAGGGYPATRGRLPRTGEPVMALVVVAAGLLALGTGLLAAGRRRRPT